MRTGQVSPQKIVVSECDIPTHPVVGRKHVSSDDNKPFKILVNHIREHGVVNPIHIEDVNGELILACPGHYFRLMAAREACCKKVPVEIISDG